MSKRIRLYRRRAVYVLLFVAPMAYIAVTVSRYLDRPPFCNTFAIHPERGFLPEWWLFPWPVTDRTGNLVLLDEKLNLLVVIPTGDPHYQGQRVPIASSDGSYIDLTIEPPRRVQVPTPANRLVIFDAIGEISFEAELLPSESSALFDQIDDQTGDAATVLREEIKRD